MVGRCADATASTRQRFAASLRAVFATSGAGRHAASIIYSAERRVILSRRTIATWRFAGDRRPRPVHRPPGGARQSNCAAGYRPLTKPGVQCRTDRRQLIHPAHPLTYPVARRSSRRRRKLQLSRPTYSKLTLSYSPGMCLVARHRAITGKTWSSATNISAEGLAGRLACSIKHHLPQDRCRRA